MPETNGGARPLHEQLASFATEQFGDEYPDLDLMSVPELVRAMNEGDRGVADAVGAASAKISEAIAGLVERMRRGGRLIYIGAGTPGRLGILDASEAPPTFGTDPGLIVGVIAGGDTAIHTAIEGAEDDEDAGRADIASLEVGENDTVIGISASGRTPYVIAAVTEARGRGAFTVGFACNSGSALGAAADVAIEVVVGPEILSGSTRLKSGTAQKLVLNMISTIAMVQLGKTYGNLMVDMKATNVKLRARAERIVMAATDADAATAARALAEADSSLKVAILMLLADVDAAAARLALDKQDGHLRLAVRDALGSRPR